MNKLIQFVKNLSKRTKVITVIAMASILIPTSLLAWGPSRDTYTIENPAERVVFNSITNNPVHGDERNFMQIREADADNSTYVDTIGLTAGEEYVVYIYYHNNASSSLNESGVGIATGAYVKAAIPAIVENGGGSTTAVGYVGASNAYPAEVWDNIYFTNSTGGDIALRYISGSATIHSHGAVNGQTMSDSIITTGAAIGYDSLNGVLPGCNEYAGYVTFRIKADQPNFTISKQVRLSGDSEWSESVEAKAGDVVDYLIEYKNTGTTDQNDVSITDVLPEYMTYITGSTYLANSNNPQGKQVADGITTVGLNIGDYSAGANAFIKFSAKVANQDELECGVNNLQNVAYATTKNGEKTDTADVIVSKVCDTPTPTPELPKTGPANIVMSMLGVSSITASASYYVASRRNKR